MKANFEANVKKFMKSIFDSNPDFSSLTQSKLRKRYIKELECEEFDKQEKEIFKSILNKFVLEYSDAIKQSQNQLSSDSLKNEETGNGMEIVKNNVKSKSKRIIDSDSDSDALVIDEETDENKDESNEKAEQNVETETKKIDVESESSIVELGSSDDETATLNKSNSPIHQVNSPKSNSSSNPSDNELQSPNNSHNSDEKENIAKIGTKKRKRSLEDSKIKKAKDDNSSSEEIEESSSEIKKRKIANTIKSDVENTSEADSKSSSDDDNDESEHKNNGDYTDNKKSGKSSKTKKPASEKGIEHLKRYIREAGIRIHCYQKLFEKCKTIESKQEKLLEVLKNAGIRGKPTLKNCRKLKKKRERQQEFESLDTSNVILTEGRPKRRARSLFSHTPSSPSVEVDAHIDDYFSRMNDVFDTDTGDSPIKKPRAKLIIDSEESN